MSGSGISRRKVLASIPAACLLIICDAGRAVAKPQPCELSSLPELLMQQLGEKKSAYVVGQAYLRIAIHEADAQHLISLIFSDPERWNLTDLEWDAKSCRAFLKKRFESDFKRGRIVEVEGWILPETEARLYALAAVESYWID